MVVRWETHIIPRSVIPALHKKTDAQMHLIETFGFYGRRETPSSDERVANADNTREPSCW